MILTDPEYTYIRDRAHDRDHDHMKCASCSCMRTCAACCSGQRVSMQACPRHRGQQVSKLARNCGCRARGPPRAQVRRRERRLRPRGWRLAHARRLQLGCVTAPARAAGCGAECASRSWRQRRCRPPRRRSRRRPHPAGRPRRVHSRQSGGCRVTWRSAARGGALAGRRRRRPVGAQRWRQWQLRPRVPAQRRGCRRRQRAATASVWVPGTAQR